MIAQLELDTYRHLVAYLSGAAPLKNFRQWFDASTWEAAAESNMIGQIELGLAELSSGHRTEAEFKEILHNFVQIPTLEIPPFQERTLPCVTTGASNDFKMPRAAAATISASPDSRVGKLHEVVCG